MSSSSLSNNQATAETASAKDAQTVDQLVALSKTIEGDTTSLTEFEQPSTSLYHIQGTRNVFIKYSIFRQKAEDNNAPLIYAIAYGASIYKDDTFPLLESVHVADLPDLTPEERAELTAQRKERRRLRRQQQQVRSVGATQTTSNVGSGSSLTANESPSTNKVYRRVQIVRPIRARPPTVPTGRDLEDVSTVQRYVDQLARYKRLVDWVKRHEAQAAKRLARRPNVVYFVSSTKANSSSSTDSAAAGVDKSQIEEIIRKVMVQHGCSDATQIPSPKDQRKWAQASVRQTWQSLRNSNVHPIIYDTDTGASVRLVNGKPVIKSAASKDAHKELKLSLKLSTRSMLELLPLLLNKLKEKESC